MNDQRPLEPVLLTQAPLEIAAGRCGDAVKLNVGDTGYYRVQYDDTMRMALTRSFAQLSPADRVNLLADTWALVEAGRGSPTAYLDLVEQIGDDSRPVWDQVMRVLKQIDRLQLNRPGRAAFQAHARAKLRPVLDRIGWDAPRPEGDGTGALRAELIRTLGRLGDEEVLTEARHRFAAFQQRPQSLRPNLRDAIVRLAGIAADRNTYDTLLALARKSSGRERERYYAAAASARDPALAQETLNLLLTSELPSSVIGSMLNAMASDGGHAELAWAFVRKNFKSLADRQGSSFRNYFVPNLMKNFSDRNRADELASFSPMHTSSGAREAAREAEDDIRFDADLKARVAARRRRVDQTAYHARMSVPAELLLSDQPLELLLIVCQAFRAAELVPVVVVADEPKRPMAAMTPLHDAVRTLVCRFSTPSAQNSLQVNWFPSTRHC